MVCDKVNPRRKLQSAVLYLRDKHKTVSAIGIAQKDYADYAAIKLLIALEDVLTWSETK